MQSFLFASTIYLRVIYNKCRSLSLFAVSISAPVNIVTTKCRRIFVAKLIFSVIVIIGNDKPRDLEVFARQFVIICVVVIMDNDFVMVFFVQMTGSLFLTYFISVHIITGLKYIDIFSRLSPSIMLLEGTLALWSVNQTWYPVKTVTKKTHRSYPDEFILISKSVVILRCRKKEYS